MKKLTLTPLALLTAGLCACGAAQAVEYNSPISHSGSQSYVYGAEAADILIAVRSGPDAVCASSGSKITIGGSATDTIVIKSSASYDAVSAMDSGASVSLTAKDSIVINSTRVGLWGQNNTQSAQVPADSAAINLTASSIEINAKDAAIVAFSNSRVNLKADKIVLKTEGSTALDVRGYSTVNIGNDAGNAVVQIDGNILFETPGSGNNSGNVIDAYVNVTLSGADSYWNGNVEVGYPTSYEQNPNTDPNNMNASNLRVTLKDGAQWTPRTIEPSSGSVGETEITSKAEDLNFLTLSGGVINLVEGADQTVNIQNLSGTGGTINIAAELSEDKTSVSAGRIRVGTVASDPQSSPTLSVNYTGITADDLNNVQDQMQQLADNSVTVTEGSTTQTHVVAEGNVRGAVTVEKDAEGNVGQVQTARNTKLTDFSSVNAMSLVQWRNEINHLTRRLGDLRASSHAVGAWARVYGGQSEWGGSNSVEMKHTAVQVGADFRLSPNWLAGGAFSYTDSDAELATGSAEGDGYTLAAYATYLADNGVFVDVIGRVGHLKNDVTAGNMGVDTRSMAYSLSVESGHQFRFIQERAYVEPQVELTYGFVSGDDATASNGVHLDQDDFQSLVTRVGVRAGFDFPENAGTFYAMVSYSYDFLGDADAVASQNGVSENLNESLGGGWVSYGIGGQFKLGDGAFAYGELERTSGGDVDNHYLFNCGVRWVF